MAEDAWAAAKWRRELERSLAGRTCLWCGGHEFRVEEKKVMSVAAESIGLVAPAPTPPRADVWCRDCGFVMSFVVP